MADLTTTEVSVTSVVVDPSTSASGRGAWVHPHPDCLNRAITRRAIARALRVPATADYSRVVAWFDQFVYKNR
ncbi:YlxR family protein [Ruania halotolerans]|nr:YlxR family protein [Ruania halotolerans]UFU05184.1 YlxR family protein [Ruania halotolerans]